jgi:hypothetical protein
MIRHHVVAAAIVCAAVSNPAFADCPVTAQEAKEVRQAYGSAQAAERAGRHEDALALYLKAQGFLCDGNPNAADAARRAAALARPLATSAEQQGRLADAFEVYEQGGHFAAADRALLALLRKTPDDVALVERHVRHFQHRALPSFAQNHADQLAAAGPYTPDDTLRRELEAMPARGLERALAKESAAFNDQYLAERVRLVQGRPEPTPAAMDAVQRAVAAEQAFGQKWKTDLVKEAQDQLTLVRRWAALGDDALRSRGEAQALALAESRAATLAAKYAGAPELLEAAATYYRSVDHLRPSATRVAQVAAQARTLGDQARAQGRFTLAIAYYDVAGADDRAEATRAEQQQQRAMRQVQPEVDAARRAAEALAAQYDAATVEAMRKQAETARDAAAKAKPASRTQETADLERELGLR